MGPSDLWLGIAVLRGLEGQRPPGQRLLDDPVSLRLLPRRWRLLLGALTLLRASDAILARRERELPGVMGSLLCRTRYIDDALRRAIADGVDQVVLLGAGFDTRPYRLPGLAGLPVFEVDHPDAQRAKRRALRRAFDPLPPNVAFAPVDFEHDDLLTALAAAGYRPGGRTFFVWEGVTQYLSDAAIDRTLRFIAETGAPGSRLAFTYIRRSVIAGTTASPSDRTVMARAARGGAPWRTGLEPADLPALLGNHGLDLLEDVGGEEFRARFLEPAGRSLCTLTSERVVLAERRGRPSPGGATGTGGATGPGG